MKKNQMPRLFLQFAQIIFLFFLIGIPKILKSQTTECAVELPPGVIQIMIDRQAAIDTFVASRASQVQTLQDVPVRFTAIQGPGGGFGFGQSDADVGIANLNKAFGPAGLNFVQCGDINDIFDGRLKAEEDIDNTISSFAYASGTVEVYIKTKSWKSLCYIA